MDQVIFIAQTIIVLAISAMVVFGLLCFIVYITRPKSPHDAQLATDKQAWILVSAFTGIPFVGGSLLLTIVLGVAIASVIGGFGFMLYLYGQNLILQGVLLFAGIFMVITGVCIDADRERTKNYLMSQEDEANSLFYVGLVLIVGSVINTSIHALKYLVALM